MGGVNNCACANQYHVAHTTPSSSVTSMEEASEIEEAYIQASFSTKNVKYAADMCVIEVTVDLLLCRYSIPKTSFSIPVTADREDLSSLINQLLQAEGTMSNHFNNIYTQ